MVKITLFGLAGTGKSTAARLLAKRNNLEYMSTGNIFREMGKERGMDVYEFNQFCQGRSDLDNELDERVVEYGKSHNNFIFESRLAWFFIPDSIKIKFDCDFDVRTKRVAERDKIDIDEAKNKTLAREEDEKRWNSLYGIDDYTSNSNFDLVIDSSDKTPEELIKEIEKFILKKSR